MKAYEEVEMILIPAGNYQIGNRQSVGFREDHEWPLTDITVARYLISPTTVTNREFAQFIEATGYQTDAEREGWSYVFYGLLDKNTDPDAIIGNLNWWFAVRGANWRHPDGPNSSIHDRLDEPVTQVSYYDARKYCQWAGVRLPTEVEWEIAAKGGTDNVLYHFGDDRANDKAQYMNTWQGNFPYENTLDDGYYGLAPVKAYSPNGYGLYQMLGNVWEWCLNRPDHTMDDQVHIPELLADIEKVEAHLSENEEALYAMRGGSFLCHKSYCARDRIASRNKNTGNSGASNVGFRVVKEVDEDA